MLNNLFSLNKKTALVTGASSGLGRHFAITLAKAGADVIVAARRTDKLAEVVEEIKALGKQAFAVSLDVTQENNVEDAVAKALAHFGKIDILINNAGNTILKPSLEVTGTDWDYIFDTHAKGTWLVSRAVIKNMIAQQIAGSIINISSTMATRTGRNRIAYSSAKAAISHMTRAMAFDFAPKIRVNAIAPGWFETDLNRELLNSEAGKIFKAGIPLQRTGELHELNGALLLLASDASSYISGSVLQVDGGYAANGVS